MSQAVSDGVKSTSKCGSGYRLDEVQDILTGTKPEERSGQGRDWC